MSLLWETTLTNRFLRKGSNTELPNRLLLLDISYLILLYMKKWCYGYQIYKHIRYSGMQSESLLFLVDSHNCNDNTDSDIDNQNKERSRNETGHGIGNKKNGDRENKNKRNIKKMNAF